MDHWMISRNSSGSMRGAAPSCVRTIGAACSRADLPARQMFATISFPVCVGAATLLNAGSFYAMPTAQPSRYHLAGAAIHEALNNLCAETSCSCFGVEFILCSTSTLAYHRFLLLLFLLFTAPFAAFIRFLECSKILGSPPCQAALWFPRQISNVIEPNPMHTVLGLAATTPGS